MVLSRTKASAPIHTWVLALLVALCLAFGLSPFFAGAMEVGGQPDAPPPADVSTATGQAD